MSLGKAVVLSRVLRIAGILAAIVVVAAVAWVSYASTRTEQPMVGVVTSAGTASIEATDQIGPAGALVVRRVVAPDDSWVVAYLAGPGGTPGAFVGAAPVRAGESLNVTVPLQGHVALSQKFVLVLNADRGIRGRFEFDATRFDASPDKPYTVGGAFAQVALVKDTTVAGLEAPAQTGGTSGIVAPAGSASIEVADRLTVINELVVDRVVAPADSWVAVYLVGDDGAPTRRVGAVRVGKGETLGVVVPVDAGGELTQKVLIALQADLGAPSVFEFDPSDPAAGPDKPYVVGGAEVSKAVFTRAYGMGADNMAGTGGGGGMSGP